MVLGGGGGRGALQVGALQALLDGGVVPDLLVGTSIGAVNAAGLALWGRDATGIASLERVYRELSHANLMDPHVERLAVPALLGHQNGQASRRLAEILIAKGVTPDLRFDQLGVRLAMVATDLDSGQPMIYGQHPGQSVFSGLLASTAVPPWFAPVQEDGQTLVDGGFVSNLPIEAAVMLGATEILALDLYDPRSAPGSHRPANPFLDKLQVAVSQRPKQLELALAEARGVPVRCVELQGPSAIPVWDFRSYRQLIQAGYAIGCRRIAAWTDPDQHGVGANAIDALIEALNSEDEQARQNAYSALVQMGAAVVPALLAALAAPQEDRRWEAAMVLRDIADPRAAPSLVRALEDEAFPVRWTAAEGLIALGQDALLPLLRALAYLSSSQWLYEGARQVLEAFDRLNMLTLAVRQVLEAMDRPESGMIVPPAAQAALHELVPDPGPRDARVWSLTGADAPIREG
jgi:NTE family protein